MLAALGFAPACALDPDSTESQSDDALPQWPDGPWNRPADEPTDDPDQAADANVRALMDVLIPADFDEAGELSAVGALEAGAFDVLRLSNFVPTARALALLPETTVGGYDDLETFDAAIKAIVSTDLNLLAFEQHPATPFSRLTRAEQEHVVHGAMADPVMRPLVLLVRAACFVAFLGAMNNDLGLRYIGFPAFEDWDDRLASRGYPRTKDGRLVDPETEDLAALEAADNLDDYTYNRAPEPTPGDDLSDVVDASGDLI